MPTENIIFCGASANIPPTDSQHLCGEPANDHGARQPSSYQMVGIAHNATPSFPKLHRALRRGRWISLEIRNVSACIRPFRHKKRASGRPAFRHDSISAIPLGLIESLVRPFHHGICRIPGPIAGNPQTAGLWADHRKRMSRDSRPGFTQWPSSPRLPTAQPKAYPTPCKKGQEHVPGPWSLWEVRVESSGPTSGCRCGCRRRSGACPRLR